MEIVQKELFVIAPSSSIIDALSLIDKNQSGFVLVCDNDGKLLGTLTDGDIRRSLIRGSLIQESIDALYIRDFKYLSVADSLGNAIELFKNKAIKFLPIVDTKGVLVNVITKSQLHAVLLQDLNVDLSFDFSSLDESVVDYEIYQRPWGFYKTTVLNDYFQSKIISVKPGQQLSLQSHNHREEHWIVAHGRGMVQIEKSEIRIESGSSLFIPKGAKHRLTNTDLKENLIITEVQIGDYLGEDDIVRYEDNYGRV